MKRFWGIFFAGLMILGAFPLGAKAAPAEVAAKSAVLMEVSTGKLLYEQNANAALAPASVTKVMTMLLIMEAIDQGRIHWQDTVTASENAAAKGGSQIYLKVGETMSVEDMVKSIAVSSANDCACAMAEHIAGSEQGFVDMMNLRAQQLGMENTHFVNCTGLDDDPNAAKHLTSAYDIALMSRQLLLHHPDIKKYTTIWMDTVRGGAFGLSNTNKMVRFYPGATGLKTGFTSQAGYCLSASAQRDGMELIAVVMGCETSKERFAACKTLLDYGFANFATATPQLPENLSVPVKLGKQDMVVAVPAGAGALLVDKGQKNQLTTEYTLLETITAPVSKGQLLGQATVKVGDQVIAQFPLVAQEAVPRVSYWELVVELLKTVMMKG